MTEASTGRRGPDPWGVIAVMAALGALAMAAYIWRFGPPGAVPMHFDIRGRVDRWGDRHEAALLLAGVTGVISAAQLVLTVMARARAAEPSGRRGLRTGRIALTSANALVCLLVGEMTFTGFQPGEASDRSRLMVGTLALIFLVSGALIGKTAPNPFVGIRTYWALKSRLAWDKSNRLAGRLFFWIGLCGLIAAPVADPAYVTTALIVAVLSAVGLSVFESWRVWRSDPDRNFP
jgi:uncharacterized membrane protein